MPKYHIERSIDVSVPPEQAFDAVSDFATWKAWSPWLIAEPDADVQISEDSHSVGSTYAWAGEVTGQGEIEHLEVNRPSSVVDQIRFIKPFKSQARVGFDVEPMANGSRVTWLMDGSMPFFLFWMVPSIKTFVGMDYERGLKMFKEYVETGEVQGSTNIKGTTTVGPLKVAGVRQTCGMKEIGDTIGNALKAARSRLEAAGICVDGEVACVYHKFDMKNLTFDCTCGFVILESENPPTDMSIWSTPSTQAFHVEQIGSYDHLGNAWSAANQHVRYKKLKQSKVGCFEIYRNDPATTPVAELHTDVYLPLK